MKKIILFFMLLSSLFAYKIIKPYKFIRFDYYISKVTYNKKYLIAGLENGNIVIDNFKTLKEIYRIKLPKIHDFMGNLIAMPIYSLDISPNGKNLLIMAEGENQSRIIYIFNFKTKKMKKVYKNTQDTIIQARYINNDDVLLGLLSDELILYDIKHHKQIYRHQVGNYAFSLFALNDSKTKAAVGDESGVVKIVNVKNGKIIKRISGSNKNKTISLDYRKNYIINGSDDRRVGVYNVDTGYEPIAFQAEFLPYAAALSPKLDTFAIQYDEKNDIMVYSMNTQQPIFMLKGHTMALNAMKYLNENEILSYSPAEIIIWKLK